MAALAGEIAVGVASFFGSSAGQEAVKQMQSVVAALFNSTINGTKVSTVVKPTPNSPAEVAGGALFLHLVPVATQQIYSDVLTFYGEAVAVYMTRDPKADFNSAEVKTAIHALAAPAIVKLGIDIAAFPQWYLDWLLLGGFVCFAMGIGLAAVSVGALPQS